MEGTYQPIKGISSKIRTDRWAGSRLIGSDRRLISAPEERDGEGAGSIKHCAAFTD